MKIFCDLETYSETPIANGSHAYAENATILLFGYAIDDEPAKVWDVTSGEPMPADLKAGLALALEGKATTVWHNGMMFDSIVLKHDLNIDLPVEAIEDTMVMAYQHGLPGSLGTLSEVFKMGEDKAKDKDGKRLVQLFCKPLPKNWKERRATRLTHPTEWQAFINYCRLDIEAERELYKKLPKINTTKKERQVQIIDARINRRGMLMDVELAKAAVKAAEENQEVLRQKTVEATNGALESTTQRDKLITYIKEEYGWDIPTMTKAELEKRVSDTSIPEPVRELLALRLMSTKTSVKKFEAVINAVNKDNRLRGCLQFRGAARTGRWSGRLFQPQNLPRPSMSEDEISLAINAAKNGCLDLFFDDPAKALSNCLRGLIIAPEGKKLVVADYSNIEGRVLAWLSGEDWKVKAFEEFDAGHGHDLYKLTYGRTFNVDPGSVTKTQRQMGKVLELAMGYQGGAGAFVTFAKGYGIDLDAMADVVAQTIDPNVWTEAESSYEYFREKNLTCGLERKTFIACDAVKRAWRMANSNIADFWRKADDAVVKAMTSPSRVKVGEFITMYRRGAYLVVELPSGRKLCYPAPQLHDDGTCTFSYMGVEQFTRKWKRIKTYGGKVVENMTQAVAADVLAEGLINLEAAGYETVLTIHDEVLAETPNTPDYNVKEMMRLMTELPSWTKGLPLAAAGFEDVRYRKD